MNRRSVPAPRSKWCSNSINYLLRRRTYVGDTVWGAKTAFDVNTRTTFQRRCACRRVGQT
ncbi:MAG: hypothetical protein GXP25_15950 [Planctomycetes bacterium]|nr:hypothetical protein [Planctomycetota bacterium]